MEFWACPLTLSRPSPYMSWRTGTASKRAWRSWSESAIELIDSGGLLSSLSGDCGASGAVIGSSQTWRRGKRHGHVVLLARGGRGGQVRHRHRRDVVADRAA